MKHLLIMSIFLLGTGIAMAQTSITDADLSLLPPASEGDHYIGNSSGIIYIGLSTGIYQPIYKTLSEFLAINNSAGNQTISDLVDPTSAQDVATKNYVDTKLVAQHISINEYLAEELVLARDGQIIYTVPSNLNGAEIIEARCSVFSAGSDGGSTSIEIVRRRNGINTIMATVSIAATSYTGNVITTSGDTVLQGDILKLDTTITSNTPPEGLTCTISFKK